ncbi:hypothetical protein K438DRAFT_655603 [Mycena galopus ATCC 62051]|nr:hypothetical protein K438DRAFT_655603 [Mycena galopus ATCC 62051]
MAPPSAASPSSLDSLLPPPSINTGPGSPDTLSSAPRLSPSPVTPVYGLGLLAFAAESSSPVDSLDAAAHVSPTLSPSLASTSTNEAVVSTVASTATIPSSSQIPGISNDPTPQKTAKTRTNIYRPSTTSGTARCVKYACSLSPDHSLLRNLCGRNWSKKNPVGTVEEYGNYWKRLGKEGQKVRRVFDLRNAHVNVLHVGMEGEREERERRELGCTECIIRAIQVGEDTRAPRTRLQSK